MRIFAKQLLLQTHGELNQWVKVKYNNPWYDVIYAQNKFVAVGVNKIAYSTDGFHWTTVNPPGSNKIIYSICYSEYFGNFYASCNSNYILRSSDGITWNNSDTTQTGYVDCWFGIAACKNNPLVAVCGENGYYSYSVNGTQWKTPTRNSVAENQVTLRCAAAGASFVNMAGNETIVETLQLSSTTAATLKTPTKTDIHSAINAMYAPNVIDLTGADVPIAVANNGYIYYSSGYRDVSNSDYTPIFRSSHSFQVTSSTSDKDLMSILKTGTSSDYTLYIGNMTGKLYIVKGWVSGSTRWSELVKTEQIFEIDSYDSEDAPEVKTAVGNGVIVCVSGNGYIASKYVD